MRTEGFRGALLLTLIIASLMSPLLLISAEAALGQDIEWIRQFGPSDNDSAYGVAVDASGEVFKVEPEPAKGFYWAYYLYVPGSILLGDRGKGYILVEPNNTGYTSDDQSVHDQAARNLMLWRRSLADDLKVPLLVPTFPRPQTYWQIYTHALDRDTLLTEIDNLKRIDLQLIAMIDDAIERLPTLLSPFSVAINVENKVLMMGFSASGMFTNRFTLLHPERVRAAAIGSPGGWPISPLGEWNGVTLRYPIGVWDVKELVGKEFEIESVKSIPLYFYMGNQDTNDSVPYQDGYDEEDKQLIFQYFGDTPIKRWPIAENMYKSVGCASRFVLYLRVSHSITNQMLNDIKTFFLEQITNTPPGQSQLYLPPDGTYTNDNTPYFEWTLGTDAYNHRLLVDSDPDFTSPEENVLLGATDNTCTSTAELADENYSWKVIAINVVGENESTVWTFTIDTAAPAAPSLLEPAYGSLTNDNTPTFTWNPLSDPSGLTYTIQVDNDSEFTSTEVNVSGLTGNTYTPSALANGNYSWRVLAVDGTGNSGDWSTVRTLLIDTVVPAAPSLLEPADGSLTNDNTPTFGWTEVIDTLGVTYTIQVDNDSDFSSPEVNVSGITENTYTPTALADENYSWRVRAVDGANNAGGWSTNWTFVINTAPPAEVSIPLVISAVLIVAAILVTVYLLRVRPKKAAQRWVFRV